MGQNNGNIALTFDLVDEGKRFYEDQLKGILEPAHIGEFLAVEPISGKYFPGKDRNMVAMEAINTMPDSRFYLMRVGYATTDKLGASGNRNTTGESIS